jgi:hypothetical protein
METPDSNMPVITAKTFCANSIVISLIKAVSNSTAPCCLNKISMLRLNRTNDNQKMRTIMTFQADITIKTRHAFSQPSTSKKYQKKAPWLTRSAIFLIVSVLFSSPSWSLDSDEDGLDNSMEATLGTNPNNPDSDHDMISDGWEIQQSNDPNTPRYSLDLHTTVTTKPGPIVGCVLDVKQHACAYDDGGKKCWTGSSTVLPRTSPTLTTQVQIVTSLTSIDRLYMLMDCAIESDESISCQLQNRQRFNHIGNPCNYGSGTTSWDNVFGTMSASIQTHAVQISGKEGMLCAITNRTNNNISCWNVSYTGSEVNDNITVSALNFTPVIPGATFFFDADLDGFDNVSDGDDDGDGVGDTSDPAPFNPFVPMSLDAYFKGSSVKETTAPQ